MQKHTQCYSLQIFVDVSKQARPRVGQSQQIIAQHCCAQETLIVWKVDRAGAAAY